MKFPTIQSSKLKNTLITLMIVGGAILVFAYLKSTKPVQPPVQIKQKIWPIDVMKISLGSVTPEQTLYGTIESNALVTASAPVAGEVDEVLVKDGDKVTKGQTLAALSATDIELPYQISKADVADTQAQLSLQGLSFQSNKLRLENEKKVLKIRESDVQRNQELINKNLASKSTLDLTKEALLKQKMAVVTAELAVEENKLKVAQLQARLAKAQANFKQAEINRTRGVVVAPYDGRIAKVSVSKGDRVNAGAALISYYGFDSLELKARIPVGEVQSVYQAMQSGESFKAIYHQKDKTFVLSLKRLAGQASASGLDAYFSIPKKMLVARPGDLLKVDLMREAVADGVAVPYSALYGSDKVYVVKDGELVLKKVQVLGETEKNQQTWVLLKGDIHSGDLVAITHLPNAITGLKVSATEK